MIIPLQCTCGQFQGQVEVSRPLNRRFVCLCNDCQAYAHYLDRVDQMLDQNGGTDIVPVFPARMKITRGLENLTVVRLSDDGIYRWYTKCCKSPIANTPPAKLPYIGLFSQTLKFADGKAGLEKALGSVFARVNGKYGIPPLPPGTAKNSTLPVAFWVSAFMAIGYLKGLRSPSPFIDSKTGKPILEPKVLSDPEYYALIDRTGRHPKITHAKN